MYLADSENESTRAFNSNIDFTEILDFPGVEPHMILDEEISIKNIECDVINGRKVAFRVTLTVEAKVFLNEDEEVIKEIKGMPDIQMLVNSLQMNSLVRSKYNKSYGKRNYCNK